MFFFGFLSNCNHIRVVHSSLVNMWTFLVFTRTPICIENRYLTDHQPFPQPLSHLASPVAGMLQVGAISSKAIYESVEGVTMLPPKSGLLSRDEQGSLPFVRVQFLRILPSGECQSMTTGLFITLQAIETGREVKKNFLP
ncbi:LOW QUALITY PROTEIN: hypothetical protein CVT26_000451 [Gymnopilus dilepis]|uniref:Uncharacterized protein n=1 Tax=Gymnopilus dilepis TaxID=231916 RepID=A0A409Y2K3_9AGAR|nr:LOW QUALITY PROTEIN: hypothetical protein CVT26_000451 [Gymnopilus dilepis]